MSTPRPTEPQPQPIPLRVRIVQVFFVVLGVLLTLALAYWQWQRWHEVDGTFQNLGYAVQWPIFGGFLVVVYRKYLKYEKERALGNDEAAVPIDRKGAMTEVPEDFLLLPGTSRAVIDERGFEDTRRRDRRGSQSQPEGPQPQP
ncbi:hypothetical protein [Corynebacterium heidelbergense]|uniref:Uncharacterized protein n=2 Tax=Corynebacterium heidelbergense TaxID=2055947 RepID=A0A364V7S9_9CORY|nr:hypothetical protein [Corynebacterium heidelbergense]RAV32668.1 hypothetical protein DLJ54_02305 [Corynebacterium heidelbergense]